MSSLGQFARRRGDNTQTAIWAEKNLALTRGPFQLFDAGQSALDQGDVAQVTALFQEGLSLGQENGDVSDIAYFLRGFALLAVVEKQPQKAARLFGAAEQLFPGEADLLAQTEFEREVEQVRAQLGEKAFAAAWAEGRTMTPEQALAAQGPVTMPTTAPAGPSSGPHAAKAPTYPAGLTAREVEVLRLVAQGLTDAQVAEHLIVSPRTVNFHLTSIYSKLQVSSRAAATRFAIEQHLV